MKKPSGTFILLFACITASLLVTAVPACAFFPRSADISHRPEFSGKLGEILGPHWFERKEKIFTGQDSLGKEELEAIYQAQLDRGVKNLPLLSSVLIRESLRALEVDDFDKAEFLCGYAKRYSPDLPSAYFTMGWIYWSRDKALFNLVREYMKGVSAILANFRVLFFTSLNAVYLISAALLLTFIVFSITIGLKHLTIYASDLKKDFDVMPLRFLIGLVKVFAIVVPVLLNLDFLWTLFYWIVLMWGFLSRRERQLLVLSLFVLVYVPWILDETADFLEGPDPVVLMSLQDANSATWGEDIETGFKERTPEGPQDVDILFALGLLNKREGNYQQAEQYYLEALRHNPDRAKTISNLGNVYLGMGRSDNAIEQYERAITLSPKTWSFYFNLHRVASKDSILSSERGGQALDMANELDPDEVARQTRIYSENMNRSVVDETLSSTRLWKRTFESFQARYDLPERVFRPWMRKISQKYDFVFPGLFLIFLVAFSFACSKKNFPRRCPLCGTPSLKFFARKIQGDRICFGCNRLFVKKENIDPKMKEKRMRQVKRFGRRKTIVWAILSVVLPGEGHLSKGHTMKGAFFIFISFLLVLKFLYWNGIFHDPIAFHQTPGFWTRVVFVLFCLAYYAGVVKNSIRIRSL